MYLHDKFEWLDYQVDLTKPFGQRIKVLRLSSGAVSSYSANTNLLGNFKDGIFPEECEPVATLMEMDVPSPKGSITLIDWDTELRKKAI